MIDKQIRKEIENKVSGTLLFDEPMSRYTSMGVGGSADLVAFPDDAENLKRLVMLLKNKSIPFTPVGNCTNLLVGDRGYRGAVISMIKLQKWDVRRENETFLFHAEPGLSLGRIVSIAIEKHLTGMEFCAGIPGTVGGAVIMNAGAYGKEIKDVVCSISALNEKNEMRTFSHSEVQFEYRQLKKPEKAIITGVVFTLTTNSADAIKRRVSKILSCRQEKHPLEYKNAGSIFKNPRNKPAGRLIEESGLKGLQIGGAEISEKHGNFIVNRGRATTADVMMLISIIQKTVKEKTSIELETEVRIIGDI